VVNGDSRVIAVLSMRDIPPLANDASELDEMDPRQGDYAVDFFKFSMRVTNLGSSTSSAALTGEPGHPTECCSSHV
jgi:hypothetical protein